MASRALPPGLYDVMVTVALDRLFTAADETTRAQRTGLAGGVSPQRLAEHVGRVASMVLDSFGDEGRTEAGVRLVHDLLAVLG